MDILDTILTNTYTTADLHHRLRILKLYFETKQFGGKFEFSPEDLAWLNSLGEDFFSKFTKENFYNNFLELEKKVSLLTPLIIYLSFEPESLQIESINSWLKKNLSQNILFDIKIDRELLGGAVLVYKGVYKDYSLRAKIQEQSGTILQEFKKYIK